jgi:hypothetical protein
LLEAKQKGSIKTEGKLYEVAEAIILVANALKHEAVLQSKELYAHEIDYSGIDKKNKLHYTSYFKRFTTMNWLMAQSIRFTPRKLATTIVRAMFEKTK